MTHRYPTRYQATRKAEAKAEAIQEAIQAANSSLEERTTHIAFMRRTLDEIQAVQKNIVACLRLTIMLFLYIEAHPIVLDTRSFSSVVTSKAEQFRNQIKPVSVDAAEWNQLLSVCDRLRSMILEKDSKRT